jgi:hypothetical protein
MQSRTARTEILAFHQLRVVRFRFSHVQLATCYSITQHLAWPRKGRKESDFTPPPRPQDGGTLFHAKLKSHKTHLYPPQARRHARRTCRSLAAGLLAAGECSKSDRGRGVSLRWSYTQRITRNTARIRTTLSHEMRAHRSFSWSLAFPGSGSPALARIAVRASCNWDCRAAAGMLRTRAMNSR